MRTIKFRGQKLNSNEFVVGGYFGCQEEDGYVHYIFTQPNGAEAIKLETISQFTGLTDENGKEIYEGDIFKSISNSLGNIVENPKLKYEGCRWILKGKNKNFEYLDYYETDSELCVIANIYTKDKK